MVEMMMKMEEEFGVEIPEDKTEDLKTINDVTAYLKSNAN
jgi:acyl carrier protein